MMEDNLYDKQIEKLLYGYQPIKFSTINNLEFIKSTGFDADEYRTIAASIEDYGIEAVNALKECKSFEDLTIYKFSDDTGRCYLAAIYDSDELWQDPELLDVFPL